MDARSFERSPAELALGYRWVVLIVALGAAALAARKADPLLLLALTLPVAGSVLVTAALTVLAASLRAVIWLLLADLLGGLVSVALTGGDRSPFVVYLSASLVGLALRAGSWTFALTLAAAVVGYGVGIVLGGPSFGPGPIVDDIGGLAAAAVLVRVLGRRQPVAALPLLGRDDQHLLRLLADRLTYAEIATSIAASPEDTKVLIARLYRRLGARTRDEAIAAGSRLGVLR